MSDISRAALQRYLSEILEGRVAVTGLHILGETKDLERPLKEYGYGTPLCINLTLDGVPHSLVLNTVKPGSFGHERMSDRAAIVLWESHAFNTLPRHVRAVDVGAITHEDGVKTLGDCLELFLLTEMVEGTEYFHDLNRIRDEGSMVPLDLQRCKALSEYLTEIHTMKLDDLGLYKRRIRELIGHSECILGLTDSYPPGLDYIGPTHLAEIEKRCIDWRWKIRPHTQRLSQVHGDFHPWNILFRQGTDFTVLDRSRGEWGEPADDLATMTINYLFYALQHDGELDGPFKTLWDAFYDTYIAKTEDHQILQVIQPFLCWRALVIASPLWYPHISLDVRMKLLNFARNVLEVQIFNPNNIDQLLKASR